jgi:hypothetical protein
MIDGTYKNVIYYDLADLLNLNTSYTLDVSKYRWIKAFAIRIGNDEDVIGSPLTPLISATYYTSVSEVTLTNQISAGQNPLVSVPNSAKSIMGNSTTSGFSTLVIPANSTEGHTLCKGGTTNNSWLWYPYRLKKLVLNSAGQAAVSDTALLLLF